MSKRGENIYHRKDGRWEGRYWVGRKPDGTAIYKSVYAKRYSDVRRELMLRKAECYARQDCAGRRARTESFAERAAYYLEYKVKPYVKESTWAGYRRLVNLHLNPAFGMTPIDRLESEDIQRYFSCQARALAHGTLRNIFSLLRSILSDAFQDGKLSRRVWENIRLPKAAKQDVRVLTREEQIAFEHLAIQENSREFILCLYTGIRLGELCALQWDDVDWTEKTLVIRRNLQRISQDGSSKVVVGTPKSASSRREIPLPPFLHEMLLEMHERRGEGQFVFSGRGKDFCDMRTMQSRFKKLSDRLNLEGVHVHTLRHTYAARCLEHGIGVETLSALLGHSTPSITLKYYVHSTKQRRFESVRDFRLLSA